jgi:hypothetical protein
MLELLLHSRITLSGEVSHEISSKGDEERISDDGKDSESYS